MAKYLRSTKIYIYISLFAFLFNFGAKAQEGNFYLTAYEKKWKFILNDTPNAEILAAKLKSEKTMPMIFKYDNKGNDVFCYNSSQIFNFESTSTQARYQTFDLLGANINLTDYIVIVFINLNMMIPTYKIGQLDNVTNNLTEFSIAAFERITQSTTNLPEEKFILNYEEVEEEDEEEVEKDVEKDVEKSNDKVQIYLVIVLIGAILLVVVLFLYIRL